ncbi:MAG: anti-sigma factor [Cyanobacteria bacterium RI_101]|nr:anti-sigma factor [Cyanobacteria bacterium RI_101]
MNEQFERLELLSAYIDGEVGAQDRQQVQQWLDTDPEFKRLYLNLLRLEREIPQLPIPPASLSAEELSQKVLARVDRENRFHRLIFCSGLVLATLFVGAVAGLLGGTLIPGETQTAHNFRADDALMVAIGDPLFTLPEDAGAAPSN